MLSPPSFTSCFFVFREAAGPEGNFLIYKIQIWGNLGNEDCLNYRGVEDTVLSCVLATRLFTHYTFNKANLSYASQRPSS